MMISSTPERGRRAPSAGRLPHRRTAQYSRPSQGKGFARARSPRRSRIRLHRADAAGIRPRRRAHSGRSPSLIRTPDQRLRVFVSSTLRELADERSRVDAAIERLRLAPVMFELGARPHPPRALYRAYLAQSDVFVGIYGDSYGWVAPDEEVSGLEDEYNLAPASMPKLIYIKASANRDERLRS